MNEDFPPKIGAPATRALSEAGNQIDDYLSVLPEPQRVALQRLRVQLREILPEATEGIRYGVPAFSINGKGVAGFGAAKHHLSYYPMSGSVLETAGEHVADFEVSKGRLIFQPTSPIPLGLLRRLVKLRLKELG